MISKIYSSINQKILQTFVWQWAKIAQDMTLKLSHFTDLCLLPAQYQNYCDKRESINQSASQPASQISPSVSESVSRSVGRSVKQSEKRARPIFSHYGPNKLVKQSFYDYGSISNFLTAQHILSVITRALL